MSGTTGQQQELLYSLSSAVTKNTFTTEALISAIAGTTPVCAYPAGWLMNDTPNPVGRAMFLEVNGIIANTAAATFALNLGFDPTAGTKANSIAVNAAYTPTASVTAPFELRVKYTCTAFATSTATFQVNGTMRYESVAAGGAPTTSAQCVGVRGTITAFDPRVANYIELFGTWSASNAANTTTIDQMLLWGLN